MCVETATGRIVKREEEARSDTAEGRKARRKRGKRSRMEEKERHRTRESDYALALLAMVSS